MTAGATEGQRPVDFTLDLFECGEYAIRGIERDRVVLPVRLRVNVGDEATYAESDVCGNRNIDFRAFQDCGH